MTPETRAKRIAKYEAEMAENAALIQREYAELDAAIRALKRRAKTKITKARTRNLQLRQYVKRMSDPKNDWMLRPVPKL
jgi:hypothetical protein